MDVDHYNPTLTKPERNRYSNLYLATRHCNGKKSDHWPTPAQRKLGIRFLDPCKEQDYGAHLFEDPETFEIWGESRAGKYHVRMLDLNAEHLVRERRRRFELWGLKQSPAIVVMIGPSALPAARAVLEELSEMIPLFPQKKKPFTPNFIYARGTFYPVTGSGSAEYFSDNDGEVFSFLIQDYPQTLHVDGLALCCQATDIDVERKFRGWIKSAP